MFPSSHKTVVVLDRSPYFLTESSKHVVDFEMFMKTKGPGVNPVTPITKSLWTCNVEAALEYVRVIYDLFPTNKLVRGFALFGRAGTRNALPLVINSFF